MPRLLLIKGWQLVLTEALLRPGAQRASAVEPPEPLLETDVTGQHQYAYGLCLQGTSAALQGAVGIFGRI